MERGRIGRWIWVAVFFVSSWGLPLSARAEPPWTLDHATRYMALGDSLAAGFGAVPATQGYVYLLYKGGVFDTLPNTLFSNAGVPGANSRHVLEHQVPLAIEAFRPDVLTLTVGGNDLLAILEGADPADVLDQFQENLFLILARLRAGLPQAHLYVSNLYTVPQIPGADEVVRHFNAVVAQVAAGFGVPVADVYAAFLGRRGLLLIERQGARPFEVHPTHSGYRVMAQAFRKVIEEDRR